jgi:hypothetical protein
MVKDPRDPRANKARRVLKARKAIMDRRALRVRLDRPHGAHKALMTTRTSPGRPASPTAVAISPAKSF